MRCIALLSKDITIIVTTNNKGARTMYKRITVEIDTSEIEQTGVYVSVQTDEMTQYELDNSIEYVDTLDDAFDTVAEMIKQLCK